MCWQLAGKSKLLLINVEGNTLQPLLSQIPGYDLWTLHPPARVVPLSLSVAGATDL